MVNGQHQVRAISNIEAGEEININYHETPYFGVRNREFRKASLLFKWFFTCSCQLCENKADDNSGAFEVCMPLIMHALETLFFLLCNVNIVFCLFF